MPSSKVRSGLMWRREPATLLALPIRPPFLKVLERIEQEEAAGLAPISVDVRQELSPGRATVEQRQQPMRQQAHGQAGHLTVDDRDAREPFLGQSGAGERAAQSVAQVDREDVVEAFAQPPVLALELSRGGLGGRGKAAPPSADRA